MVHALLILGWPVRRAWVSHRPLGNEPIYQMHTVLKGKCT